jgi:ribonucleoside-diphosphate reductase alpha chain
MIKLSENAKLILEKRYLKKNSKGNVIEKPEDLFKRVAENIALADAKYILKDEIITLMEKNNKEYHEIIKLKSFKNLIKDKKIKNKIKKTEKEFYGLMTSLDFLPNSPTLFNAGRELQQLAACFVLPVEDNIDDIFKTMHYAALIAKSGSGTGFNFSKLRPKNDVIKSITGFSSGPLSFMKMFDSVTEQIKLGGLRRGALMGVLRVDHPDIEEFITIKSQEEKALENFNISVAITNKFMDAVKKNKDYFIINPRNDKKVGKDSASRIFSLMCEMAWKIGDPGVIFIDRVNEDNPTPKLGSIESTDSCGEQPLLPYESANLGSINLTNFTNNKKINYKKLGKVVHTAVHFLDNVIDMCNYPSEETKKIVKENRKIGLGIMGFADMLIKLEVPYDSDNAVKLADSLMGFIRKEADKASVSLAKERGFFPSWENSIYNKKSRYFRKKHLMLRNATRLTLAPTGTISIIANCSFGIEPLFALSYIRTIAEGKELYVVNESLKKILVKRKIYNDDLMKKIVRQGSIKNIQEIPEDIKKIFTVSYDINPVYHVKMQAAFQKHVDNAVSKTVILPGFANADDVRKIYLMAYDMGCKGISIYRYGSIKGQVLYLRGIKDQQISLTNWLKHL